MMARITTTLLLLLALQASARDVITEGAGGGVNWTQGYVWADGYGVAPDGAAANKQRLLARRAAQVDAYRNLAEFLYGVRVTSETVVRDMALESDTVRTRIDGLVKNALVITDHYQNDVAQVRMRIHFDGDFSSIINHKALEQDKTGSLLIRELPGDALSLLASLLQFGISRAHAQGDDGQLIQSSSDLEMANRLLRQTREQEVSELLQRLKLEVEAYRENSRYTGLLVDASGVPDFELATIPRLRDPSGKIIYPTPEMLNYNLATRRPVSYDFAIEDAVRHARVAVNPYVVKATSVFKSRTSDLVIDARDADFIRENANILKVMNNAGVIIVVAE